MFDCTKTNWTRTLICDCPKGLDCYRPIVYAEPIQCAPPGIDCIEAYLESGMVPEGEVTAPSNGIWMALILALLILLFLIQVGKIYFLLIFL